MGMGQLKRNGSSARWALGALASVLVVAGIPALILSSPGSRKALRVAGNVPTTAPKWGDGEVTPYGTSGESGPPSSRGPASSQGHSTSPGQPTTTTVSARRGASPTTANPRQGARVGPAASYVEPRPPGHWESQKSGTTETLWDVSFPDSSHGWAVGENGTIIATSDGGNHWAPQTFPATPGIAPPRLMGVSFADATHGWAVGWSNTIIATSDGGAHWASQLLPDPNTGWTFMGVSFVDHSHGWAIAWDGIMATTDGGSHWTKQLLSSDVGALGYGIYFKDAQHGWAAFAENGVRATTDGGAHWALQPAPAWYLNFGFSDTKSGWAVGPYGAAVTHDGGGTWEQADISYTGHYMDVAAVDGSHAWVTGPSSTRGQDNFIWATADGVDWYPQWNGPADANAISFPDATHGWAVGYGGLVVRYFPD